MMSTTTFRQRFYMRLFWLSIKVGVFAIRQAHKGNR